MKISEAFIALEAGKDDSIVSVSIVDKETMLAFLE